MPDRWALVPVEPAEAMVEAAHNASMEAAYQHGPVPAVSAQEFVRITLVAGIAAAPDPTQDEALAEQIEDLIIEAMWDHRDNVPIGRADEVAAATRAVLALLRGR